MLRALILAALTCALLGGAEATARPTGGTPAVFVAVEGASELVGVDLTTARVVARVRVPAGPREVVSYGARHVLVASPGAGAVALVDSFEERVLHVWRGFGRPVDLATNGSYAYVADAGRSEIAIINLGTWRVRRVQVRPAPRDVALGDVLLVTHGRASGNLTVAELSWDRGRVVRFRHFPAGGAAEDITRQPDSAFAYVAYSDSGVVGALDWGTETRHWQRHVGVEPAAIAVDPYHGRRLWIADHESGIVLALSTGDGRVLRRLQGCPGARGVTAVGGASIVASCGQANAIAYWSQRGWERTQVHVGNRPHGLAEVVLP